MRFVRLFLFPLSLLYGLGVLLRNLFYDVGVIRSHDFDVAIISVGNLAVGGSGKSPMTEYLVRLLKDRYKTATLSRGYGRKTKGFLLVDQDASSRNVGDEPLQFRRKFSNITVAVCEDRVEGIRRLEKDHQVIVLDDAYQHRAVRPGLSILLFDYNNLFNLRLLLPAGDLREPVWEMERADIIVITKTPPVLDPAERRRIISRVNPRDMQEVFFSYLEYGDLIPLDPERAERKMLTLKTSSSVILLTGIAKPEPLLSEIRGCTRQIIHHVYPDHHHFSRKNIVKLVQAFHDLPAGDKLIITTEKDAQRLYSGENKELLKDLPVYFLPVRAVIHEPGRMKFNNLVEQYAAELTAND
jgi:tetraacyldisaccharide 4'-kinase